MAPLTPRMLLLPFIAEKKTGDFSTLR